MFALSSRLALVCCLLLPALAVAAEQDWQDIRQPLDASYRHAEYWQYGWTAVHASSLVSRLYVADHGEYANRRYDARVNAVISAMAVGDMLLRPAPHLQAKREVDRLYAENPDSPEALLKARALFQQAAQAEVARRQWQSRMGSFFVNLAAGLAIGIGDDRPRDGALNFASGMLVNEIKIYTYPDEVSSAAKAQHQISLGNATLNYDLAWVVTPQQLAVDVRF